MLPGSEIRLESAVRKERYKVPGLMAVQNNGNGSQCLAEAKQARRGGPD